MLEFLGAERLGRLLVRLQIVCAANKRLLFQAVLSASLIGHVCDTKTPSCQLSNERIKDCTRVDFDIA